MLYCFNTLILPEAILRQVPQSVDMEAVRSRLQPIDGPINQADPFREL